MQTISKSKLKAHMLRVFREIEASGEELIVTDRDQACASHTAYRAKEKRRGRCLMNSSGQLIFREDPDATTIDEWTEV